jgi:signal transduction histidine kinase/PAS domain-containing protein
MTASLQRKERGMRGLDSRRRASKPDESLQDRQWAEAVLAGEKRVLEMIASSSSLNSILEDICRLVEQTSGNCISSIYLLDAQGRSLHLGAAPNLPQAYSDAIDDRAPADGWGPCGIAASQKRTVIISDIKTGSPCAEFRDLALAHGLQACWSTPILAFDGKALGSFAVYCRKPRKPTERQRNFLEQFAHLASIAIERTRSQEALRRSQSYLAEAQKLSHTGSFGWNLSTGELIWSDETFNILGYDRTLKPTLELVLQRVHPGDIALVQEMINIASHKIADLDFEHRVVMPNGLTKHLHVIAHPIKACDGEIEFIGAVMDITERKRAEAQAAGEKRLLEMIARGGPLRPILDALCRYAEELSEKVLVSILLVSDDGRSLQHGAAPSLPESYTEAIDGALIGPSAGSCGTAVYRRGPVIVPDISMDTLWENYRHLALPHRLRACWSTPIFSAAREVMGTFALYSREPGTPTAEQQNIIEQLTHLAAVAIERERAAEALRASAGLARGQAEALSRTLDALAMESAPDRLVEHVMCTVVRQLGAHSTGVWLRNQSTGLVHFEFAFENGKLFTASDAALASISPALKIEDVWPWPEIFRTGTPRVMEDIRDGPSFPWIEHVLAMGVVTILVVPMLVAGQVEGVIGIRFTTRRTFRSEEMELAQALAHQAMLAIQLMRVSQQSREAAVVAERNRMARDIHDTLAQGFTGVIVQLEAAADATSEGLAREANEHIARASDLARGSLREARRSVQALRPQALEEKDLCGALEDLLGKMTNGTQLRTKLAVAGRARTLPALWGENLLRIGQEVLTNSLRHASASEFEARLSFNRDHLRLTLRDDGRGFDPVAKHDGFGLRGIRERVEAMNGQLTIQSGLREGTIVSITLPFGDNVQAVP